MGRVGLELVQGSRRDIYETEGDAAFDAYTIYLLVGSKEYVRHTERNGISRSAPPVESTFHSFTFDGSGLTWSCPPLLRLRIVCSYALPILIWKDKPQNDLRQQPSGISHYFL